MRAILALLTLAAAVWAEAPSSLQLKHEVAAYLRGAELREFLPATGGFVVAAEEEEAEAEPAPDDDGLGIGIQFWYPQLDGDINASGTLVDAQVDLGLDEHELTIVPKVGFAIGFFALRFDGFFLRFDGDGTLTRSITFGGITFDAAEAVDARVSVDHVRLLVLLRIVRTERFIFKLIGGAAYYRFDVRITGSAAGTASATGDLPLPMVGFQARVGGQRFFVLAEVAGFALEYDDIDGTIVDARLEVGVRLLRIIRLSAGYRVVFVDGSDADLSFDGTLDGFFVTAGLKF